MKLIKTLQMLGMVVTATLIASNASAQKLYKWVDAEGNISYQDQPPPENAKVLDEMDISKDSQQPVNTLGNREPIKVYTTKDCPICVRSLQHLQGLSVPVVELSLDGDRAAQALILEKTSSVIAPTVVIGEEMLQAPSNDALSAAVEKAGYKAAEKK